jgi:DNA adenine methylase
MTDDDHREVAAALRQVKGAVIVSSYPCPLYDELYEGWTKVEKATFADGARRRIEVLWLSPAVILERSLF